MRNRKTKLFAILLCFLATGVVLAQVSENYDLSWNVIGGGGGPTGSANYAMRSTVGQAAIGYSSSDNYGLGTGEWYGVSSGLKGDLNSNGVCCDAGDLVLMKRASIGEISADSKYDL
ncbi:MAG: hypothetical protein KAJ19_06285, partial [Gammaproteobacteria bacterium]|nr:hypothetical protein [Gammaproteobacteria bacterium]